MVNEEEDNKISYKEFINICEKEDYNIVDEWDKDHFKIICNKCHSENVIVFFREESGQMGSEYTGYMRALNWDNGIIVKCKDCGNAMSFELPNN